MFKPTSEQPGLSGFFFFFFVEKSKLKDKLNSVAVPHFSPKQTMQVPGCADPLNFRYTQGFNPQQRPRPFQLSFSLFSVAQTLIQRTLAERGAGRDGGGGGTHLRQLLLVPVLVVSADGASSVERACSFKLL